MSIKLRIYELRSKHFKVSHVGCVGKQGAHKGRPYYGRDLVIIEFFCIKQTKEHMRSCFFREQMDVLRDNRHIE